MRLPRKQIKGVCVLDSNDLEVNKSVYRNFIQLIFNEGQLDRLSELVSPEYTLHDAPPGTPTGVRSDTLGLLQQLGAGRSIL